MTRAATLLLALLLMNVLLGGICLAVSRGEARSRALRFWGTGLLLYAAGLLITILPLPAGKVAGNALIAAAPMLCVAGALEHTRTRLSWRWLWIAFVASVLPIAWNHLRAQPNVLVDFLSPAPLANLLFCIAAWTLFRAPPADARPAARFVAATFAYSVLVWTLRMALIIHSVGATNDRERADLTVALFCIAQMVSAVAATLGLLWIEVRLSQATLERVAWLDPLTNLFNRRATLLRFREELARARRADAPLALAVLDVDHFKRFNDEHGHLTGDAVLTHVASVLGQTKREGDVLGRVGGEEFVLLFAGQKAREALEAVDRLRERVADSTLAHGGRELRVTLSAGVAVFPGDGADWDSLFAAADLRLYAAKNAGRNRVAGPTALIA
ncbi:MAG TPA: GGDEF domain-containing protein [Myxococcales bacterium]|jgi:diguanylate cyclase (GGDEF)-like protein|nr:GGDEF domain-containing protein [Myxococcales bacterium]